MEKVKKKHLQDLHLHLHLFTGLFLQNLITLSLIFSKIHIFIRTERHGLSTLLVMLIKNILNGDGYDFFSLLHTFTRI